MEISIGILIIGSLYWDERAVRTRWRRERLDLDALRSVRASIRYSRRSQSRGNSYTMVFSEALGHEKAKLGMAIFVPFKRRVQKVEHLDEEAEILWTAERNSDRSNGRISDSWGCVALALNPVNPIPHELCEGWATRVSKEKGYGHLNHADDEQALVSDSGLLKISWPQGTDGTPLEADALLATGTNPTLIDGRYPSAEEIAAAWRTAEGKKSVDYFLKKRESEIFTFQDDEIECYLNGISS
ncbi:MAG: hypothetical protein OEW33_14210 [Nitrospirota bacterium]|nr:hypothetical protein [Nitrospirota bacterium]